MFRPLLAIFRFPLKYDLGTKGLYVMRIHQCLDEGISTSIVLDYLFLLYLFTHTTGMTHFKNKKQDPS
jgi:hypothetical protein